MKSAPGTAEFSKSMYVRSMEITRNPCGSIASEQSDIGGAQSEIFVLISVTVAPISPHRRRYIYHCMFFFLSNVWESKKDDD